jgi:hypothetical protein
MNIDLLQKKFDRAVEYEQLIQTKGYVRLKQDKLDFVQKTERAKTLNGLEPNHKLDEDLVEARTYLRFFEELENTASKVLVWESQLKENGIVVR